MSKLSVMAASLVVLPVFALTSSVSAEGMGQIAGGDIYRVSNITKNSAFADSTNATCGETVQFKVRMHNGGPSPIGPVRVVATLPAGVATSFTSRVTASAPNADPTATSDTATVNLDKAGSLKYVAGSTEVYGDSNPTDGKLEIVKLNIAVGDTITSSGIVLNDGVGVSLEQMRLVQFNAKVECEPTVVPKDIQVCKLDTKTLITIKENEFDATKHSKDLAACVVPGKINVCELSTKKVITIDENKFDAAKHSKDLTKCDATTVVTPPLPETLPNTGAGAVASLFAATSAVGAAAHHLISRRRRD